MVSCMAFFVIICLLFLLPFVPWKGCAFPGYPVAFLVYLHIYFFILSNTIQRAGTLGLCFTVNEPSVFESLKWQVCRLYLLQLELGS